MKEEEIDLYCKKCSKLLTIDKISKCSVKELNDIDEKELIPTRGYIDADQAEYNFRIPIKYLIHSKSLRLNDHHEGGRFSGCCGPSEFDSLNQICIRCKSEIGVLIADCWTSVFIGIDESKISLSPTKQKRKKKLKWKLK